MSTASGLRSFGVWVVAACVLHVVLVALAGPGFMSSDDEVYARLANDMARGAFELFPEHRCNRLGLIAPTALAYAALGVGRWTTVLWPLAWSCTGIAVVASVARRIGGDRAGVLAAFLLSAMTLYVNGSAFLIPDGPVGVQMLAAAACLWRAREVTPEEGRARAAAWGAGSALLVVVGVMNKLTTLWMAPLFAVLFVMDLSGRRHRAAWTAFAAVGVAGALVFFGAYHAATGDALYRLHAVQAQHNDTHWAYHDAGAGVLLARLTYEPALLIARRLPELALLIALALPAVLAVRGGDARTRRRLLFWTAYAVVVIAGFWVGTTSFERIAPLPLLPRMLAPGATPLAILAGCILAGGARGVRVALPACAVLAAGAAVAAADGRLPVAALYVAAGVGAAVALSREGRLAWTGALAVVALPLVMCGYSILRDGTGESADMRAERRLVQRLASTAGADAVVLTDRRSERTIAFYRRYEDVPPRVEVWDDVPAPPDAPGGVLVYHDEGRAEWRGGRMAPPAWLEDALPAAEVVDETRSARLLRLRR